MTSKLRKYIGEQPHTPSGLRYKTPILVSDSKGSLYGTLAKMTNSQWNPGAFNFQSNRPQLNRP